MSGLSVRIGNLLTVAGLSLALASCGGGGGAAPVVATPPPPPPPTIASVERDILPQATGAGIDASGAAHFAINPDPAVTAKGKLFVMLPGTGASPAFYRLIVRTGPPRGYHAIGLEYPNADAVGTLCAGTSDPDCPGKVRREIITGEDASSLVAVTPANSITGRLTALLTHLNSNFPNEGWGQFLSAGAPNWRNIIIAGHSQGGGHAGYFAKLRDLERVIMFSAPADTNLGSAPALWAGLANVTPAARQFGFIHTADTVVPFAFATANWRASGLEAFGATRSVDGASAPFGDGHQLSTSAAPNPAGGSIAPTHGAPVVDAVTPLDGAGQPLFRPVWIYLAFP